MPSPPRIKATHVPDVDGMPGDAIANMAYWEAHDILQEMGFWDYIGDRPVPLSKIVVRMEGPSSMIQDVGGNTALGRELAKQIVALAQQEIEGFGFGRMEEEQEIRDGGGGGASFITEVPWNDVSRVKKSAAGAVTGVYFLDTPQGKIVLKPSDDIGNEAFALMLAEELGLGTPDITVLEVDPSQLAVLTELEGGSGEQLYGNLVAKDHMLAMSFVEGFNLMEMDIGLAERIFGSEAGDQRYQELGRLAAFDLWTNNTDRFPIAGSSNNPGNVMFSAEDGHVIAIDQAIGTLGNHDHHTFGNIERFALEIQGDPSHPSNLAVGIKDMIRDNTKYDPGDGGARQIQAGIVDGLRRVMKMDEARLNMLRDRVSGVKGQDDINVKWLMELLTDALQRHLGDL